MNIETPTGIEAVDHVVGIGASAGGLEALEALFDHLDPGTGAAFVVITHLSPDFKSIMDELLARRTSMPVHVVEDGDTLQPNRVYVIPPGKDMIVQAGRLFLTDRNIHGAPSLPIDLFFGSLAREYGRRGTAVILSGTGADGARGARKLREAGGLVIAQSLDTARFDGMPRAAAETGAVDLVLPPEEIGPALADRFAREATAPLIDAPETVIEAEARVLTRILEIVLGGANVDFGEYKKTTVMRRIARRMQASGLDTLSEYLSELERSPSEARDLANDLLIVVTEFFRDQGAFDALATKVIPNLIEEPADDRAIRIWVPGVATGQEAYSIAMLMREAAVRLGRDPRVQIFATDVNPIALERAAAGVYTENEMANVSQARREAFFGRTEDGHWQIAPEIRNWIVFAPHNMLRDPPFINTDLISCRNALIYFETSAQQKSLSLFHFSLAPGGFLMLGPSESIGEDQSRFAAIDSKWRIFRKRAADRRDGLTVSDLIANNRWSVDSLARRRVTPVGAGRGPNASALQTLLERYAPAGLLVGRERELLHVIGAGRDYLDAPGSGPFTQDVVKLAKEALRIPLATGIERVLRTGEEIVFTAGDPDDAGGGDIVFRVEPVGLDRDGAPERLFVSFGPAPTREGAAAQIERVNFDRLAEQRIAYLEDALRTERDNLQSMLEQLETSNEELQSTNEELMTANEELQSTNEELHSVNEELYTVNAEYERKNEELTQLSKDVSSLLQATGVGVVFVDRALSVRRFTTTATRVVNLIPGDEGRHLSHITHRLPGFDFCAWLEACMASGELAEEERCANGGTVWTVRAAPVKDGRTVSGAVVSLIEVTRLVSAEAEARARTAELRQLLDWVGAVSLQFSAAGRLIRGSGDWEAFTGQTVEQMQAGEGQGWLDVVHPEDAPKVKAAWEAAHEHRRRFRIQARLRRPEGGWRPAAIEGGPELDRGRALGWFVYVRDAAEAAGARSDAALSDRRAAALAELAFAGAYTARPEGEVVDLDPRLAALIGFAPGETDLEAFEARLSPASRLQRAAAIAARAETGGRWMVDVTLTLADGRPALFREEGMAVADGSDDGELLVAALRRIERAHEEATLAEEIVRSSPVEVIVLDAATHRIERANAAALRNLGFSERELVGLSFETLLPQYDAAALDALLAPLKAAERPELTVETFALRRDGSTYDLALALRPMSGGARVAAIGRDVSERRRTDEALRRRTEALARSNRDLEQFAFLAGHDLVAPLRRIALRAGALKEGVRAKAAVAEAAEIETLAAKLADQVRELLAFARSAPTEDAFTPVDLAEAARAAATARGDLLREAGATVEIGALPTVRGSAPMIQVVFENLIENAVRSRAPDRAAVIRIGPVAGAPRTVEVADNGRGFDPSRAAEIFRPAVRLEPSAEGAGMGLAICRRVMEAHGGEIAARATPGVGAVFTLSFGSGA